MFAITKLTGQAKRCWIDLIPLRASRGEELIDTWSYVKDELKGKYVPPYYYKHLLDRWRKISQSNKSVKEYVNKFGEFLNRYNVLGKQSEVQVFSQFCVGLQIDLEHELCKREITELKGAYELGQDLDVLKLSHAFRSQNHQAPTFKSTSCQYLQQVHNRNQHTR